MMSSADLLEDGFPHGTPDGYEQGCRGAACPTGTEYGLSCKTARLKSRSDYQYQRLAKTGATVAEIADALGLVGTGTVAGPKKQAKAKAGSTPSIATAATVPEVAATAINPGTEPEATEAPAADTPSAAPEPATAPTSREIRAWAREKGYDVSSRGIIKAEIVEHYWDAHGLLDFVPVDKTDEPASEPLTDAHEIRAFVAPLRNEDGTLNVSRIAQEAGLPAWIAQLDAPQTEPQRDDTASDMTAPVDGDRPDFGTMNLETDLADERDRVKDLTTELAIAQTELDTTIEERDQARDLAIRLEQELTRLEQTRDQERAATAAARRADADTIDAANEDLAWHRLALDERTSQIQDLRTALATVEKAFELVLQKWDDATRNNEAETRAAATLAYIDKSLDNVADLDPDLPWLGSEVIEILEDTRALLVTDATTTSAPMSHEPDWYDTHCPTCDAPEPNHTPTCAVVHVGTDREDGSES